MPYISPKDTARIRADAAAAELAANLERTGLHDEPVTSESVSEQGASDSGAEASEGTTTEATEPPSPQASSSELQQPLDAPSPTHDHSGSPSPAHTPNAPSLISCATDSSCSVRTLSSAGNVDDAEVDESGAPESAELKGHEGDFQSQAHARNHDLAHSACADLANVDLDEASPELAQYHREIYAFTMALYDRAKERAKRSAGRRRAREERAAAVNGSVAAVKA